MSDYSKINPKTLLQARLGMYIDSNSESAKSEGVDSNSFRLNQMGGHKQQQRMIEQKKRSMNAALERSYQGAKIIKYGDATNTIIKALINPNKIKQDYDDKIISVNYEDGLSCGDVFEWQNTGTFWLIYLQDLTELAYFRGNIRKCSYKLSFELDGKTKTIYAAVRGPQETMLSYGLKHDIVLGKPNYTLNLLLPKNEDTLTYFQRYSKFYLQGTDDVTNKICWQVQAVDSISTSGIIEVSAKEYYANEFEDDLENGVVGALIAEPASNPDETNQTAISGEGFIKPKKTYKYVYTGNDTPTWTFDKKYPITYDIDLDGNIDLKWTASYSGSFVLSCNNNQKTIVVESLF